MTSSTSPRRSAALMCSAALLAAGMSLSACTASAGPDAVQTEEATRPAPTPTATSEVGPGSEPTTHDGRTVLPARPEDCSAPSVAGVKDVLGPIAVELQPAAAKTSARDGLVELNCTFALAPVPAGQAPETSNSLLVSTTTAADEATLDRLGLPRLMMAPETVPGLGAKAWYSVNTLSGSTEYVLEVVDGLQVTRLSLGVAGSAGRIEDAQQKLIAVAKLP